MSTSKLQFLVVEDDEDDYCNVRQLLNSVGNADVERAASADAAVQLATERSHDVCLLDYRLGDKDGLEVLRELKNRDVAAPVIFLTGQGDEEVAVQAMKAGAVDYLLKSKLTAPSLGAAVRYALTLHKQEQATRASNEALRRSEQEYRTLFENANDAIMIFEPKAETILEVNRKACEIYGFAREELVGMSLLEVSEDANGGREAIREVLRTGVLKDFETVHRRKDGSPIYILANASLVEYRGRKAILSVSRDITERQAAEAKLRTLYSAVEQAADMVVMTDRHGCINYVNPAFERVTGYSRSEVVGKTPRILKSGKHNREYYEKLWQAITAGQVFRDVLVNRKKNGDLYYAEKTITPVVDPAGEIVGFISNDRDITERRMLEEQLLHAQKMEAVGKLAGGVAHDFNNLLMVISSYAELLSEGVAADSKAKHQAAEILTAARRAAGLTQQLLAFSRKQVLSPAILDLNAVIEDFSRMLPRLIGEDIRVVVKAGNALWKVKVDPMQAEQVIMNLAVNARDAMPLGGQLTLETANVHLDEEYARRHLGTVAGDYVLLAVSDTGCGIAPEILPHIFEPFFTTKEQGKGTGLGLPTVYGIVKQSGGSVWVYSEVGHGTAVTVYLPRAEQPVQPRKEEAPAGPPPRGSETLLVVEDEDAVRESTSEYLVSRGYTVVQGKNGPDAVQVLEHLAGKVDLLITDVVMPGMSGAELAKRVREMRLATRVLFISGYTESTVVEHGIEAQYGFLQKPFTLTALGNKVREVLDVEAGNRSDRPALAASKASSGE